MRTQTPQKTIVLEFTRGNRFVLAFEIDWQSWQSFQLVAWNKGYEEPRDYLLVLLATCLSEGDTIEQVVEWLFAQKRPSGEVAAPRLITHQIE